MSARALVLALVVLGGCMSPEGDPTPLPGQAEALDYVWREAYGETRPAPRIYWRRDICGAPNGIYAPLSNCSFHDRTDVKVSGLTLDDGAGHQWIEVGAPWGEGAGIADTAFAHELLHASIGDPEHTDRRWIGPDGLVYQVRAELERRGL